MSPENKKKLWHKILKAGDFIKDKLPPHPKHPKGRNPYAHIASCINAKFGFSYKDLPDDKFEEVLIYISFIQDNPY